MTQNRSTAVMQRRVEAHDSLDDFPTPPWATRALCEFIDGQGIDLSGMICREPAANRGHMVRPLAEYFAHVEASDVHDYGAGFQVADYLFGHLPPPVDWTITNPPFRLAAQFIERALDSSDVGVAVIVRSAFLEGQDRCTDLFTKHPPAFVLQLSERCGMFKGRLMRLGTKFTDAEGKERSAATATSYCWIVWLHGEIDTRLRWIAPCRDRLDHASDYPVDATLTIDTVSEPGAWARAIRHTFAAPPAGCDNAELGPETASRTEANGREHPSRVAVGEARSRGDLA